MKIFSSNYNLKTEECELKATSSYHELNDVIKMDCLIDTISELENLRTSLSEKMYNTEGGERMKNLREGLNKYVKLNGKIKTWLLGEISDAKINCHEDDVDSRELGILDGRLECAENLLEQITKWEEEDD